MLPSDPTRPADFVSPVSNRGSSRWLKRWICLILVLAVWAVFGQTRNHQFINFDDDEYVAENPVVSRGLTRAGILWAFGRHADNWHPLTWLSHMLDCQLYQLSPAGPHITNVALHALVAVLLFLMLADLTGQLWPSGWVAAIFALHPLRAESVAWISERKDLLSGLFFVLTLWAYGRFARRPASLSRYALALLFFALGLLCKPMLVTVPVILCLMDYWPLRRNDPLTRLIWEKIPFLLISAASCAATLWAQTEALQSTESFPLPVRFANALLSVAIYLRQFFDPARLGAFYPYFIVDIKVGLVALALAAGVGISWTVWEARVRRPWLLVGWGWFLAMLLPVAGVVQVGEQAHADRYTYLPEIGLTVALVWSLAEWRRFRRVLNGGLFLIALALGFFAYRQTAYWKNSETLWTHTLAVTSENLVARLNLAGAARKEGHLEKAITIYKDGLPAESEDAEFQNSLGNALLDDGKIDEAIEHCQLALQLRPGYGDAMINLGNAYLRAGRVDDAMGEYRQVIAAHPKFALAHNNLATLLLRNGNSVDALSEYRLAIAAAPTVAEYHRNLAGALQQQGKIPEAMAEDRKILQIQSKDARALLDLAHLQRVTGDLAGAIQNYRLALQTDPTNTIARISFGNVLLQSGDPKAAIAQFQLVVQQQPASAGAHLNLGLSFFSLGRWPEALTEYRQTLQLDPENFGAQLNLAWLLCTCPQPEIRQGAEALRLTEKLNQLTQSGNSAVLRNWAAALAETGRYPEALRAAQQAREIATAQSNRALIQRLDEEIKSYQAGQPFREKSKTG